MKAPISWIEEYTELKFPLIDLMWKLTEVGLTTESFEKIDSETVLDCEVTPNRPDWMSMIGIAREISAIQNTLLKLPQIPAFSTKNNILPIKIKNNFELCPRYSAITIKGVTQKPSPEWMQKRLKAVGLRPINNLVDITNYVMFETGNPIHVFDYDKLHKGEMTIIKSIGGEKFKTVDEKTYTLPKDAIIFKSGTEVVDLCGIKGGFDSGISPSTTNILILVAVYNGKLIRRTSQHLSLWSEASRIFERGANVGGTVETLKRTAGLILETAGGIIASSITDVKKEDFKPWKIKLSLERLEKVLGIKIKQSDVASILKRLLLEPVVKAQAIECTIPTYRGDLRIEEDLIEEVARLYGYNNFPKTLPIGEIPTKTIPYYKDYNIDSKIKKLLTAAGFSEVQTYSLISESDLVKVGINSENVLRVDNPVSREFEYLRPTLKSNLLNALTQNKPFSDSINLFEVGKVYSGKTVAQSNESYDVSGITNKKNYFEIKGLLERIFSDFNIDEMPAKYIERVDNNIYFSFPYLLLNENSSSFKKFHPLPKYPPIIEDMAFLIPESLKVGEVMEIIKSQSSLIKGLQLFDKYEKSRTFRIIYQDATKNLTTDDISSIREKIIKSLKNKGVKLK